MAMQWIVPVISKGTDWTARVYRMIGLFALHICQIVDFTVAKYI